MDRKTKNLIKKLDHKDPKVRYDAVMALGKLGDTALLETLGKVATLDDNPKVRDLAGKAVNALNKLQQREVEKQKAALKAQMAAEKIDWPTLAQERMTQHRDYRDIDSEEWSYEKRLEKVRAEKEAAEAAAKKAAQRTRFRFRLVLYIVLVLIALAAGFVLREVLDDTPDTAEAALEEIKPIIQGQQAALLSYCDALAFDKTSNCQQPLGSVTLDCKTIQAVELPEAFPEWLVVDDPLLVDDRDMVLSVTIVRDSLAFIHDSIKTQCEGKEAVTVSEWADYLPIGNLLFAGLRDSANNASYIEIRLNPPDVTPTPG